MKSEIKNNNFVLRYGGKFKILITKVSKNNYFIKIRSNFISEYTIRLEIQRNGESIFRAQIQTSQMKRRLEELVAYLGRELDFPHGVFLMTGTGIVPGEDFTLKPGDRVAVTVGQMTLQNDVYP